jgi:glycosyltransferase involved in cell wall biosynthesis
MAMCAIVSFRLGRADGVSVVAATWHKALGDLGFAMRTVAGDGPVDVIVPGLAIDAPSAPTVAALRAALTGVDLVVVENLLSIPLNLPASRVLAEVLRGRPAILHHHDPSWQRARFAHVTELPPRDNAWRHVTINELTRRQMADRGIEATTIYNGFDVHTVIGDRATTRAAFAIGADERLLIHPVRAIARKNIPKALEMAEALDATYWLLGEPEENYDAELARVLARARTRVIHRTSSDRAGFYAASDIVAFPSTWEGFGNPPIEAAIFRRPVAVGHYPVAAELRALGFRWYDPDDIDGLRTWFGGSDERLLDHNQRLAREHFSFESMRTKIEALLAGAGWLP